MSEGAADASPLRAEWPGEGTSVGRVRRGRCGRAVPQHVLDARRARRRARVGQRCAVARDPAHARLSRVRRVRARRRDDRADRELGRARQHVQCRVRGPRRWRCCSRWRAASARAGPARPSARSRWRRVCRTGSTPRTRSTTRSRVWSSRWPRWRSCRGRNAARGRSSWSGPWRSVSAWARRGSSR